MRLSSAGFRALREDAARSPDSGLDFFDLLRRGIEPEALRRDHRIPTYGDAGLSSPAFLDLLSLVINLIGLIR
jgi:hypothetical protein